MITTLLACCRPVKKAWSHSAFALILLSSATSFAAPAAPVADLDAWIQSETSVATAKLLANISPAGTATGAVIASPSRANPDYFYHWIRDAGLVMEVVQELSEQTFNKEEQQRYSKLMFDYVDFSRRNQLTANPSGGPSDGGLGEPKFNVDGSAFTKGWGRPQNDGPAIRANTLIRLANRLLTQGREDYVHAKLYDARIPAETVIKADLEYVSHHWREKSFDVWEEVFGQHFYTRMVQRRSLIQGADLADRLGDGAAASWYRSQAREIEGELLNHWDGQIIRATRDGGEFKASGLDTAVILGVLHAGLNDGFMSLTDDRVLSTVERIKNDFKGRYAINWRDTDFDGQLLGTAMGRYPEDKYTGYNSEGLGNPWYLLTNALGEFYYKAARRFSEDKQITVSKVNTRFFQSLPLAKHLQLRVGQVYGEKDAAFREIVRAMREAGDAALRRTKLHAASDGSLDEQMNRDNGYAQGARDLTWSYASMLTAIWAR
jgi:glucoamylase